MHLVFLKYRFGDKAVVIFLTRCHFLYPISFCIFRREEIKRGKIPKNGHGKFFNPTNVKGIAKELNKLANNYNYYQKIKKKKLKFLKKMV